MTISEALLEVEDLDGIDPSVPWTLEDIAYQEIGDPFADGWQ